MSIPTVPALVAFDLKYKPSLVDAVETTPSLSINTVDNPIKSSLFLITNNSCVLPDKGIAKLPSESFGSSVYATFNCLLDTSGTVSNTFCPVLNG